jgi:hypothetical protein
MEINKLHCSACFYRDSAHPARKWPGPLGTSAHRVKQGINDPPTPLSVWLHRPIPASQRRLGGEGATGKDDGSTRN